MAIPEPDELWEKIWDRNNKLTTQERYDDMLNYLLEEQALEDPENTTTPSQYTNGTVWAPLTDNPTSTTNVEEPRTLAAGYDPKKFILTVQFRDGTLYNYYDIPPSTWRAFRIAPSKGEYLRTSGLDDWPNKGEVEGHSKTYYAKKARQSRKAQGKKYATIEQLLGKNR